MRKNKFRVEKRFLIRTFVGLVTIQEDTRGFIRTNFNQQFIVWPTKYDPQALLLLVLDHALAYVRKQDRGEHFNEDFHSFDYEKYFSIVDDTNPNVLTMFTKTLAIIDCISTLILIRPEYYDRFNDILLRIVYLLPGYLTKDYIYLCKFFLIVYVK